MCSEDTGSLAKVQFKAAQIITSIYKVDKQCSMGIVSQDNMYCWAG